MDARSFRFASQFPRLFAVAAVALFLVGCDVKIINRTPATFSANPSGVYTITAEVRARPVVRKGTLKPTVVIDGQPFPMQPSELGGNIWEFDYHLPAGRTEAAYYIIAPYETTSGTRTMVREAYIGTTRLSIINRYSLSLDASRAPVGAQVTVLGRGFTQGDTVYVGTTPAQTIFKSENSLAFVVPPLAAGRNYPVSVGSPGAGLDVGTLRIDEAVLRVTPSSLSLATGDRRPLAFALPTNSVAPPGGLTVRVETDVPASVIMPDVVIPEGSSSFSVFVEGGAPGSGTIFVSAPGFAEARVSITVVAR